MKTTLILFATIFTAYFLQAAPNPAYVNCIKNNGTIETRTDNKGNEFGICMFDQSGVKSECNQWDYFRGECAPGECAFWSVESRTCENPMN